jgi:hypothetical protein
MSIVPGSTNSNPEVAGPGSQLLTGSQLEQIQQGQHQATLGQRHTSLYGDKDQTPHPSLIKGTGTTANTRFA